MGVRDVKLGPPSRLLERAGVVPAPSANLPLPERAGREGEQVMPVVGQRSVFAEMRRRLEEREAIGVKRYGRSLETFNGRSAGRDLEDELLDGFAYATQLRLEREQLARALILVAKWGLRAGAGSATALLPEEVAAFALAARLDKAGEAAEAPGR